MWTLPELPARLKMKCDEPLHRSAQVEGFPLSGRRCRRRRSSPYRFTAAAAGFDAKLEQWRARVLRCISYGVDAVEIASRKHGVRRRRCRGGNCTRATEKNRDTVNIITIRGGNFLANHFCRSSMAHIKVGIIDVSSTARVPSPYYLLT